MGLLERWFRLTESGTTVRREVGAGLVTFAALSYILFVQPAVLSLPPAGMDPGGVLFATCVASAFACFLMAWWANYPVALAPAMGHNFFFVFAICAGMGFTWQQALAANLIAGCVFLALSRSGFREQVLHAIPDGLKAGLAAGIGLLIALVGLKWGAVVVADEATYLALGDLSRPVCLLFLFGLALNAALFARKVPGAWLIGVIVTALVGLAASALTELDEPLTVWRGIVGSPPSPVGTAFQLDFGGLFARHWTDWFAVIAIFLILDLFDSVGSLVALGRQAGLMKDGKLPGARGALAADAAGTTLGAALGTSTVTSYVESAAGIAAGGRTGLTAVVVGLCMLAGLVLTPLVEMLGAGVPVALGDSTVVCYPVIAPLLVLIGALMMNAVRDVAWDDAGEAIPAFLVVFVTPLSLSITDGLAWGFIAYSFLSIVQGRALSTPVLVHVFAVVFVLRYVLV